MEDPINRIRCYTVYTKFLLLLSVFVLNKPTFPELFQVELVPEVNLQELLEQNECPYWPYLTVLELVYWRDTGTVLLI